MPLWRGPLPGQASAAAQPECLGEGPCKSPITATGPHTLQLYRKHCSAQKGGLGTYYLRDPGFDDLVLLLHCRGRSRILHEFLWEADSGVTLIIIG